MLCHIVNKKKDTEPFRFQRKFQFILEDLKNNMGQKIGKASLIDEVEPFTNRKSCAFVDSKLKLILCYYFYFNTVPRRAIANIWQVI